MYKMHMYRNGALPVVQQSFHTAALEVLRCSYWAIRIWNHASLASPYWRLYWNAESGAEVQWQQERFPLDPDHLLLIAPNTPFTTRFAGEEAPGEDNVMLGCPVAEWDSEGTVVHHFFTHFIVGAPYDTIAPQVFFIPIEATVRALLNEIILPHTDEAQPFTRRQSLQLRALLYHALGHIPDQLWPAPQTDERVVAVMRHIDAHLDQRLTNDDFAGIAAMSAKAFVRLFKEHTHQTPLDYLLLRRLEKASILLHHTDDSIERIAEQCGFCDRHHFSKLFQRTFNIGPATYRKTRML